MKIGVQVFSVRDYAERDFRATMQAIKAMGYDGVELAGTYGLSAEEVKAVLDEVGLTPISAHVQLADMYDRPEETFKFYQTIGIPYIAIPWLGDSDRPAGPTFPETLKKIAKVGQLAKDHGMTLLYHNHDFEFTKIGDEYGLDVIYKTVPADLLQTEIDTCWVKVSGVDPAAYVLKYAGRAPIVHLKDFYKEEGSDNEGLYELIGVDKKPEAKKTFEFRPCGHGMQKFEPLIAAVEKAGAQWVIVEQDRPSLGLTSMESIELSMKYLRSLGL